MARVCEQEGSIAIVEDDVLLAKEIKKRLKVLNKEIFCFETGELFFSFWKKHKNKLALVLLDLGLPHGTGADLIPIIKEGNPLTKIVIITGLSTTGLNVRMYYRGADDFLEKPLDLHLLLPLVKRRLEIPCIKGKKDSLTVNEDSSGNSDRSDVYHLGNSGYFYDLDVDCVVNSSNSECLHFTPRESQVFKLLVASTEQVVPKQRFVGMLDFIKSVRTLSVWIGRLNKKLEKFTHGQLLIHSVYGLGYILKVQESKKS